MLHSTAKVKSKAKIPIDPVMLVIMFNLKSKQGLGTQLIEGHSLQILGYLFFMETSHLIYI